MTVVTTTRMPATRQSGAPVANVSAGCLVWARHCGRGLARAGVAPPWIRSGRPCTHTDDAFVNGHRGPKDFGAEPDMTQVVAAAGHRHGERGVGTFVMDPSFPGAGDRAEGAQAPPVGTQQQ